MSTFFRICFALLSFVSVASAQLPTAEQQIPDLRTLPDVSQQLQQQLDTTGQLILKDAQHFRITTSLNVDLHKLGAVKITADGGGTLIMDGPGPAIRIVGDHAGTASPKSFRPATWNQRMPIVTDIEILGSHPEADGIELNGTVGAVVSRVSIRWCRHGVHLVNRNRNVIISDCHVYENSAVGIFLDDVNLHQMNIGNSHVSYNRGGGIVVRDGNVRNVQITGCDIEANMPGDETATTTANVLLDVGGSADDKSKSIAEVSITGCTIQHSANYSGAEDRTVALGGANIRIIGKQIYPVDSVTISGNVLSDTTQNIDLKYVLDVAIVANNFFAPKPDNLIVEKSRRVVISSNTFNPRQFVRPGTIRLTDTHDSVLTNNTQHAFNSSEGSVQLHNCSGFILSALNFSDCGSGIVMTGCRDMTVAACRVSGTTDGGIDFSADESNQNVTLIGNAFSGTVTVANEAIE